METEINSTIEDIRSVIGSLYDAATYFSARFDSAMEMEAILSYSSDMFVPFTNASLKELFK